MGNRKRWRSPACPTGKVGFRTGGEARRAVGRIERENAQAVAVPEHPPSFEYRCPVCRAWHLATGASLMTRDKALELAEELTLRHGLLYVAALSEHPKNPMLPEGNWYVRRGALR